MRVAIYGGTFDPPHIAHLVIAQEVTFRMALDRLLFVPAAIPPHKQGKAFTDGALRLEMVRAATRGIPGVEVSDIELRREGPSFTVDTLRALRSREPDAELHLILGADQVRELDTWREPDEVRRLAKLVVFERAGQEPDLPDPGAGEIVEVQVPRLDISSTGIRRRVKAGEPIRFLVPDAVRAIIEREGLYR